MAYVKKPVICTNEIKCYFCGSIIELGDIISRTKIKVPEKITIDCCSEKCRKKATSRIYNENNRLKKTEYSEDESVECRECGRKFASLQSHVNRLHGLTMDEYKTKFGLSIDECFSKKYINRLKESSTEEVLTKKDQSLNGFIRRYGEQEGTIKFNQFRSKVAYGNTIEYYIEKYGDIIGKQMHRDMINKANYSRSLNGLVEKYGEETGTRIWNDRNNVHRFNSSEEGFKNRFGSELGAERWRKRNHLIGSQNSLEFLIGKYGTEDGTKKWEERCAACKIDKEWYIKRYGEVGGTSKWNERRSKHGTNKEWFINRYGHEEGLSKYNNFVEKNKFRFSVKWYLLRYGEEEGHEKYNQMITNKKQALSSCLSSGYSKIAQELFESICKQLPEELSNVTYYKPKTSEFIIRGENNKRWYFVDFKLNNKIIEFNGDYWHANPNKYSADDILKRGMTAQEIWDYDCKKNQLIVDLGYDLRIVWEKDYRTNREKIVNDCLVFLLGDSK